MKEGLIDIEKNIANLKLVYYVNMVVDAITIITKTAAHAAFANANKNENQGHNRDMPDYGTLVTPSCETHGSLRIVKATHLLTPALQRNFLSQLPFTCNSHKICFKLPFF